jgi:hypothetical protein
MEPDTLELRFGGDLPEGNQMNADSQVINIRDPKSVRVWASKFDTTPKIIKLAVKRVGASPRLVENYLTSPPDRGSPDLYSKFLRS